MTVLLWRNSAALVLPMLLSEPLAEPVTKLAMEILVRKVAPAKPLESAFSATGSALRFDAATALPP
jgi:hypothetical protein